MSLSQAQVPTIIASSVVCLVLGAAAGAVVMYYNTYDPRNNASGGGQDVAGASDGKGGNEGKGPPGGGKMGGKGPPGDGGGMPKGGGFGGGMPKGGGFGGGQPTSKTRLATLVTKLDQLTTKPLELKLTDDQRAKIAKELEGLDAGEGVSEDEAKKRLDAILAVLEGDRGTLEAAGFRWPGDNPQRPAQGDNPFAEGDAKEHLKKLQERVGKAKTT